MQNLLSLNSLLRDDQIASNVVKVDSAQKNTKQGWSFLDLNGGFNPSPVLPVLLNWSSLTAADQQMLIHLQPGGGDFIRNGHAEVLIRSFKWAPESSTFYEWLLELLWQENDEILRIRVLEVFRQIRALKKTWLMSISSLMGKIDQEFPLLNQPQLHQQLNDQEQEESQIKALLERIEAFSVVLEVFLLFPSEHEAADWISLLSRMVRLSLDVTVGSYLSPIAMKVLKAACDALYRLDWSLLKSWAITTAEGMPFSLAISTSYLFLRVNSYTSRQAARELFLGLFRDRVIVSPVDASSLSVLDVYQALRGVKVTKEVADLQRFSEVLTLLPLFMDLLYPVQLKSQKEDVERLVLRIREWNSSLGQDQLDLQDQCATLLMRFVCLYAVTTTTPFFPSTDPKTKVN